MYDAALALKECMIELGYCDLDGGKDSLVHGGPGGRGERRSGPGNTDGDEHLRHLPGHHTHRHPLLQGQYLSTSPPSPAPRSVHSVLYCTAPAVLCVIDKPGQYRRVLHIQHSVQAAAQCALDVGLAV